jgi:hypothetical protein
LTQNLDPGTGTTDPAERTPDLCTPVREPLVAVVQCKYGSIYILEKREIGEEEQRA